MRRVTQRNRVYLPSCQQATQDFAHFAARRQWRKEQLHVFHGGRNHSL
jgi:hypothetical protein